MCPHGPCASGRLAQISNEEEETPPSQAGQPDAPRPEAAPESRCFLTPLAGKAQNRQSRKVGDGRAACGPAGRGLTPDCAMAQDSARSLRCSPRAPSRGTFAACETSVKLRRPVRPRPSPPARQSHGVHRVPLDASVEQPCSPE